MSFEHLRAMLWLRWMLLLRQWRRGSAAGAVVTVMVAIAGMVAATTGFGLAAGLGVWLLPRVDPAHLILVWDGVLAGFLFFWAIGLMTELQRSEPLSLAKLLHLPVSLTSAFLLNYAASWLCLSIVFWLPAMVGLALGSAVVFGPASLVLLAPIGGLMLLVTALTHQLRGWLAVLMSDRRRRGTVLVMVTIAFVLVANIPGLAGIYFDDDGDDEPAGEAVEEGLSGAQLDRIRKVNLALPPGWLAVASVGAARGSVLPALLATLGTVAVASASLTRGYRATLRVYRSEGSVGRRAEGRRARAGRAEAVAGRFDGLLGWHIPRCPEQAAAVALASFRMLLRAPYTKMVLLTPVILIVVFGGLLLRGGADSVPERFAPLLGFGAIGLAMLSIYQLVQNLFGYDGDGFRVYVLSSVPRGEILLGKNLSLAPVGIGVGVVSLSVLQVLLPMRPTHLAASFLQLGYIYLVCCMVGNLSSVLAPMAMSSGTMQPAKPGAVTVVKQLAFALLIPVAASLSTLPLGLEMMADLLEWGPGLPIYLILSIVELPLIVWIYRRVVAAEGRLLAARERRILETVAVPTG